MKRYPWADGERIRQFVVGDCPALRQIADNLVVVVGVDPQEQAVEGSNGVDQPKGLFTVAVI